MSAGEFNDMLVCNSDYLKPFAFTLTKNNDAAKDLMQETIYKALANREKYNAGTNVKAWMYTIMRNIFINDYRRRSRQQMIFDPATDYLLVNNTRTAVPNTAEMNMRLKDLRAAIHRLPNIFRDPFQLYFDGYKYTEIAKTLHEPLGTIKSRIHFARKLLREQLPGY